MTLFALAVLLIPAAAPARLPSDAELTKAIEGKWSIEATLDNGLMGKGITAFRIDGVLQGLIIWTKKEGTLTVKLTGTWEIKDGEIVQVVETCEPPTLKKGHTSRDKIISLDAMRLKIKDEKGKVHEMKRTE